MRTLIHMCEGLARTTTFLRVSSSDKMIPLHISLSKAWQMLHHRSVGQVKTKNTRVILVKKAQEGFLDGFEIF